MASGQDASGQQWRFINKDNGYYQLQSLFLEGANKCLEGNKFGADSTLGGAAFMADCADATVQLWSILDDGNDTFQLQTQFLEAENQCLDGNQVMDTAPLGGGAFMADCDQVAGHIWTATRATDFEFPVPSVDIPDDNPIEYGIGDTGPAGGIVFYLDGTGGGLEAAPEDQSSAGDWGA